MGKDFKKTNDALEQYCSIGYDECHYICDLYNDKSDTCYQDARMIAEGLDLDLLTVLLVLIRSNRIENDVSFKFNHPDDVELHKEYDCALGMEKIKSYSRSMIKAEEKRKKESEEKTMRKLMSAKEKEELMPEIYKRYMNDELPEQMAKDYDRSSGWISRNLNEWVYNNITDNEEISAFEAQKVYNRATKAAEGKAKKAAEKEPVMEEQQTVEKQILSKTGKGKRSKEAEGFLKDILSDGPVAQRKVESEAKNKGIKMKTLRNVKKQMGVQSLKCGDEWFWSLSQNEPQNIDTVISLEDVAKANKESAEEHHKNKIPDFYKAWMYNARQIESMAYEEGMSSAALKEELYKYGETVELTPEQIEDMVFYRDNVNKKASYDEWLKMYQKVKAREVDVFDAIDQLHMSMKDYRDLSDAYERGEQLDAMLAADTDVTESKTADIINIHVDNCWNNLFNLRPLLEVNLVNDSLAAGRLAVFSTRSKPNENEKCYKEACDFLDKYVCSYDDNGNCIVNKELCVDAYDKDSLYMTELINACFSRKVVVVLCVHDHNGRILYNERFPRDNAKDLFNVFGNATRVDAVDMTLDDVYAADELYEVVMSINNGTDDTYIWKVLFADQESALKYQKDTYFNTLEGEVSETSYAHKCKMVDGKLTEIGGSLGGWFSNFAS